MTDDGPVYFSSSEALDKFQGDPRRYAGKTAAQREALRKLPRVQVTCPVTGNPIDGRTTIVSGGKAVDFCCRHCPAKYESEPGRYAARLEASHTYQTRCPLSGDPIDPTDYVDLSTGQRVYFCCSGDAKKFLRDPAKYTDELREQGIEIEPETKPEPQSAQPPPENHGHNHDRRP
jgi:YHS domain-containing protein